MIARVPNACKARAGFLARLFTSFISAIISLFIIFLQTSPGNAEAVTTGARVGGDDNRTRFVADVSQAVNYSVYVLPDPYRVIIDMPGMTFNLPTGIGRKVRGLVTEYRYGVLDNGKSRIVIDTKGPVLIEKSFLVAAEGSKPARIVVDLVKTTEAAFVKSFEADQAKDKMKLAELADVKAPEITITSIQPPTEKKPGRKVIVLDPGHGGIDPGAISPNGTREKDIVMAFAQALRKALTASGNYDVILTRTGDKFISLRQRVEVAHKNKADLLIAIHADTVKGKDARGATIYTLSDKASDAEAEELAKKENRSDIIGGLDLQTENQEITDILIDLTQRESKNHAVLFSKKVVTQLKPLTLMTGKPMRSAGFMVLKAPDVPSVLLELGYLSSQSDEKLLKSAEWHKKIAKAFATAVDNYFSTELVASNSN